METAAEIKVLSRGDPVPLDLLVRFNLLQRELTRLGINSIALLNRTVKVAPDSSGSSVTCWIEKLIGMFVSGWKTSNGWPSLREQRRGK